MPNRPVPTALKLLAGNPGRRPINENEPQPEGEIPSRPDFLDDIASDEWDRVSLALYKLGLLTSVDRSALAAYVVSYSRWVRAEQALRDSGLTSVTPSGFHRPNALVSVANAALDQMRRYLVEFGMTPAARSRVTAASPVDADDFFEVR